MLFINSSFYINCFINKAICLHIIAESVPFKPNISKLSERIDISRNNLVQYIKYLEDMRIIRGLYPDTRGIGLLQKPEKIYLHHPNLQYALADEQSNVGNMRESYFINQVGKLGPVTYTAEGDFDEIEIGHQHKIPLWLFGFLY